MWDFQSTPFGKAKPLWLKGVTELLDGSLGGPFLHLWGLSWIEGTNQNSWWKLSTMQHSCSWKLSTSLTLDQSKNDISPTVVPQSYYAGFFCWSLNVMNTYWSYVCGWWGLKNLPHRPFSVTNIWSHTLQSINCRRMMADLPNGLSNWRAGDDLFPTQILVVLLLFVIPSASGPWGLKLIGTF